MLLLTRKIITWINRALIITKFLFLKIEYFKKSFGSVDILYFEGLLPATCSLDPEVSPHVQTYCSDMEINGSREKVAGSRDLNCQKAPFCLSNTITYLFNIILLMLFCSLIYAADPMDESHGFTPIKSTHAHWVFSGIVVNENGENYNYFFKMQRVGNDMHATVALFDTQTKKIILKEDSHAHIDDPNTDNWSVGRAFLRFNAMNDSWIFGLKDQHSRQGFNFKVDMLNRPEQEPVTKYFRHGISFIVVQTGQLNGIIQLEGDDKEQFVTANNAWFRQIWLNNTKKISNTLYKPDQLNGLLCRFNDGSGLYSMKVLESDSLRGAVVGFFDSEGAPSAISQFIHIEPTQDNKWLIRIPSPKMHLVLTEITKYNDMLTGFISNKEGFCVLSQDNLGMQAIS